MHAVLEPNAQLRLTGGPWDLRPCHSMYGPELEVLRQPEEPLAAQQSFCSWNQVDDMIAQPGSNQMAYFHLSE